MNVVVIDGQGGGIGKSLIEQLKRSIPGICITAVGTNSAATAAMLRAGADLAATGENAVVYNCAEADVIAGPVGILLANSMLGEVTPAMAAAVTASCAEKVLIPVSKCRVYVCGSVEKPMAEYIDEAVKAIGALLAEK